MMTLSTGDISEGTGKVDEIRNQWSSNPRKVEKDSRTVGRVQELAGKPDSSDLYRTEGCSEMGY